MELSTSLNVLYDPPKVTQLQALDRVAAAGFRVLDFNFCDWLFEGSPFVEDTWESWVRQVCLRAEELEVRFSQAHGPIFNKFEDSESAKWLTDMSHRALEAAGMLGVKWIVFEPETSPGAFDHEHLDHLKQRNLDWFGALIPTAEESGAGIAIENCPDCGALGRGCARWYGGTPSELIDLVDSFQHPLVGICWDTGHAHMQRLDQGKALRSLGQRLKATHIQDNDGDQDQHLFPFLGTIDWTEVVGALKAMDYQGDFTFEVHNAVRTYPDNLRDGALRFAVELGNHLLTRA